MRLINENEEKSKLTQTDW